MTSHRTLYVFTRFHPPKMTRKTKTEYKVRFVIWVLFHQGLTVLDRFGGNFSGNPGVLVPDPPGSSGQFGCSSLSSFDGALACRSLSNHEIGERQGRF